MSSNYEKLFFSLDLSRTAFCHLRSFVRTVQNIVRYGSAFSQLHLFVRSYCMYLLTGSWQTKEIDNEKKKKRLNSIQFNSIQFNSMHINEEKIEKLRKL